MFLKCLLSSTIGCGVLEVSWMFPGQQLKRFFFAVVVSGIGIFVRWSLVLEGSPRIKIHKIIYVYFYSELCALLFLSKQLIAWFSNAFSGVLAVILPFSYPFLFSCPSPPQKGTFFVHFSYQITYILIHSFIFLPSSELASLQLPKEPPFPISSVSSPF